MDQNFVFVKTPAGEEVIRLRTRVVQRNLRMVLILVDGKTTVGELGAKINSIQVVEDSLCELEQGGFIARVEQEPSEEAPGVEVEAETPKQRSRFPELVSESAPPVRKHRSSPEKESNWRNDLGVPVNVPVSMPPKAEDKANPAHDKHGAEGESVLDFPSLLPLDEAIETKAPAKPRSSPKAPPPERKPKVVVDREPSIEEGRVGRRLRMERHWQFRPAMAFQAFLGLLVLAGIGVVFYPYERYKPGIEAVLTNAAQAPVQIGSVSVDFSPLPVLKLRKVALGAKDEVSVDEISAHLNARSILSWFASDHLRISAVDLTGLKLAADNAGILLGFGKGSARKALDFSVGPAKLRRVTIRAGDIAWSDLEGEMVFKEDGEIDKVRLNDGRSTVQIEAFSDPKGIALNIAVDGENWTPIENEPQVFKYMQAKGVLQPRRIVLNDVNINLFEGTLIGNGQLTWKDGIAMTGQGVLAHVNLGSVMNTHAPSVIMNGTLAGKLKLNGQGKDWPSMWNNIAATLDADLERGVLTGIDIVEAATRSNYTSRGGTTRFDHLRAVIDIDSKQVKGSNLRLDAGLLSATGNFVVDRDSAINALLDVNLNGAMSGGKVPVKISGKFPNIAATAAR